MRALLVALPCCAALACEAPFAAPPAAPEAWTPRQVRVTAQHDGTVQDELLRPDRSVALIATLRRDHPVRLRALDAHGRERWDCELAPPAAPRCALRGADGQLLDEAALLALERDTAAHLAAWPEPRSARDRRWLERAAWLARRGLPLAVAAALAREELSSGHYYVPERRPISDADHWH